MKPVFRPLFTNALLLSALVLPAGLFAGFDDTPLARSVPADVCQMVHVVDGEEDDFIQAHHDKVWKAFQDSGIIDDFLKAVMPPTPATPAAAEGIIPTDPTPAAPTQEEIIKAEFEALIGKLKAVKWAELCGEEFVMAERYHADGGGAMVVPAGVNSFGPPEMAFFFRGSEEAAPANFNAFVEILKHVASKNPQIFQVVPRTFGETEAQSLQVAGMLNLVVAHHGDIVAIGLGDRLIGDCFALLDGTSEAERLVESDGYKKLFKDLPKAELKTTYFNMSRMAGAMESGMNNVWTMAAAGASTEEEKAEMAGVQNVSDWVFDEMKFMNEVASTSHIDGESKITSTLCTLNPEATNSIIYQCASNVSTIENWSKYIPSDAVGYSAMGDVGLRDLYQKVRSAVETKVPNGTALLAEMDGKMAAANFNIDEMLFSWLTTEIVSFQLPSTGPQGNAVTMIKLSDPEKAKATIDTVLKNLDAALKQQNGMGLMFTPATSLGEGFQKVAYAPMAGMLNPVIGIKDGYLIIGTVEQGVQKALDTAAGKNKNITDSDAFKSWKVKQDGEVTCINYKDRSNLGNELSQAFGMMGLFTAMATGDPSTPPQVRTIMGLLPRMAPIVAKIDFLDSEFSMSSRDGNNLYKTKVVRYKPAAK